MDNAKMYRHFQSPTEDYNPLQDPKEAMQPMYIIVNWFGISEHTLRDMLSSLTTGNLEMDSSQIHDDLQVVKWRIIHALQSCLYGNERQTEPVQEGQLMLCRDCGAMMLRYAEEIAEVAAREGVKGLTAAALLKSIITKLQLFPFKATKRQRGSQDEEDADEPSLKKQAISSPDAGDQGEDPLYPHLNHPSYNLHEAGKDTKPLIEQWLAHSKEDLPGLIAHERQSTPEQWIGLVSQEMAGSVGAIYYIAKRCEQILEYAVDDDGQWSEKYVDRQLSGKVHEFAVEYIEGLQNGMMRPEYVMACKWLGRLMGALVGLKGYTQDYVVVR